MDVSDAVVLIHGKPKSVQRKETAAEPDTGRNDAAQHIPHARLVMRSCMPCIDCAAQLLASIARRNRPANIVPCFLWTACAMGRAPAPSQMKMRTRARTVMTPFVVLCACACAAFVCSGRAEEEEEEAMKKICAHRESDTRSRMLIWDEPQLVRQSASLSASASVGY